MERVRGFVAPRFALLPMIDDEDDNGKGIRAFYLRTNNRHLPSSRPSGWSRGREGRVFFLYISTPTTRLASPRAVVPPIGAALYHCEPLPAVAACADGGGPPLPPSTPCTVEGWLARYGGMPPSAGGPPGPPRADAAWDAPEPFAPAPAPPEPGAGLVRALRFPGQSKKLFPFAEGAPMEPCGPFVAPVGCA